MINDFARVDDSDIFPQQVLLLSVIVAFVLSTITSEGMFLDGLIHASIARNFAIDYGSWNELIYTETFGNPYQGHPPLFFWLQSHFFSFFGDFLWVERLFCVFLLIGQLGINHLIWKELSYFFNFSISALWFHILWLSQPIVWWSYQNNILEIGVAEFASLAVLFILRYARLSKLSILFLISLSLVFAFLVKGAVGLFPLLVFSIILTRHTLLSRYHIVLSSAVVIVSSGVLLFMISEVTGLQSFWKEYYSVQFAPNVLVISNYDIHVAINFFKHLISNTMPLLILFLISSFIGRSRGYQTSDAHRKFALTFMLIWGVATIPIILSQKQSNFYQVIGMPYLVMTALLITHPVLKELVTPSQRLLKCVAIMMSVLIIMFGVRKAYFNINGKGRDAELIKDLRNILIHTSANDIIRVDHSLSNDWELRAYLARVGRTSLTEGCSDFVITKNFEDDIILSFLISLLLN